MFVYTVQFKSIPELIPVCCSESYSRYLAPRATPDLLDIYLFCWTESYSRTVAPRLTPGLVRCRKLITYSSRALRENEIETISYI